MVYGNTKNVRSEIMELVANNILNIIKHGARQMVQDDEQGYFVTTDLLNKAISETMAEIEFLQEIHKRDKAIQSGDFMTHDDVLKFMETV